MTAYAFPFIQVPAASEAGLKSTQNTGMTLKDWFAGQIIAAMLGSDPSNSSQRDRNGQLCKMESSKLENMATTAYQVAEALMLVRAQQLS